MDSKDPKIKNEDVLGVICGCFIYFGANIAMMVVGTYYRQTCQIGIVPQFLQVGGGLMLTLAILGIKVCIYCSGRTCIGILFVVVLALFVSKSLSFFSYSK